MKFRIAVDDARCGTPLLRGIPNGVLYDYHRELERLGWKIVRPELTENMVAAAEKNFFEHLPEARDWTIHYTKDALQDGIAASPSVDELLAEGEGK